LNYTFLTALGKYFSGEVEPKGGRFGSLSSSLAFLFSCLIHLALSNASLVGWNPRDGGG